MSFTTLAYFILKFLNIPWGKKLVVFIEFVKEILRTCVLRMTEKGLLINIKERVALFVILSEAKNLLILPSFSSDVFVLFKEWRN